MRRAVSKLLAPASFERLVNGVVGVWRGVSGALVGDLGLDAAIEGREPSGEVAGVVGPRAETAGAGGVGEGGESGWGRKQPGNRVGDRRGVDAVEGDAAAVAGGFTERAVRGADAGFAVSEAFQNRQAEALDE